MNNFFHSRIMSQENILTILVHLTESLLKENGKIPDVNFMDLLLRANEYIQDFELSSLIQYFELSGLGSCFFFIVIITTYVCSKKSNEKSTMRTPNDKIEEITNVEDAAVKIELNLQAAEAKQDDLPLPPPPSPPKKRVNEKKEKGTRF